MERISTALAFLETTENIKNDDFLLLQILKITGQEPTKCGWPVNKYNFSNILKVGSVIPIKPQ